MLRRSTFLLYPFIITGIATSITIIVSALSSWSEQEKDPVPIKTFYIFLAIMIASSFAIMMHNLFCNSSYEEEKNISVADSRNLYNIVFIATLAGALIAIKENARVASTTEQQAQAQGRETDANEPASRPGTPPATSLVNVTSGPGETRIPIVQS